MDRLEEEVQQNWEALKQRESFRKLVLIEVLKVMIKAQQGSEKETTDLKELIQNVDVSAISSELIT
ncbi:hypothetical protein EZY14_001505 [Kordia sp. TARA_039_SRF]|nr:hypothetical protein EZY14_001505 [Kordia sp. TARA_039_SRF]